MRAGKRTNWQEKFKLYSMSPALNIVENANTFAFTPHLL
jgi:hypothetical protein